MWQRIQTVYIALTVILLVLCCCMPLALFEPQGMEFPSVMYSLVLIDGLGVIKSYCPMMLFVVTAVAVVALIFALAGYRNRRRQIKICRVALSLELLWIVMYAVLCILYLRGNTFIYHTRIAAFFPVAAIVLILLAIRGIKKDDELIRSADRIR